VTVTVQASADAIGEATPNTVTNAVPKTAIKNSNFPLLGNLQPSPIHDQVRAAADAAARQPHAWEATDWSDRLQCRTVLVARDTARRYPVQAIELRYLGMATAFPPRQPEKRDFELLRLKSNLRAGGTRL
jgi:hypothetical protein